jgi:hypothetical protein
LRFHNWKDLEVLFTNGDKETLWSCSARQKVLLLQKGAATDHSLIAEHPEQEVCSVLIPHVSLRLTLMDRFGFTIFLNWLLFGIRVRFLTQ